MKLILSDIRKSFSLSFLTILFSGISLATLANGNEPVKDLPNAAAEVIYIASADGNGLFNVVYNNTAGSRFSVIVLDENGNQLYQSFFSDRKFDRKFKLADPESTSKLTFVIRNFGDKTVQRFQVNTTNKMVEEVQVKELR